MRSCWLTSRWTVPVWAKPLPQRRAAAMAVNLSFIWMSCEVECHASLRLSPRRGIPYPPVISLTTCIIAALRPRAWASWAAFAPALKALDDALEIRSGILLAFERAEREPDAARRLPWLTFVVIGAGATGVELAGTLAEIARHTLRGEFRHFDPRNARVVLVEGTDRVLPLYPPELAEKARL